MADILSRLPDWLIRLGIRRNLRIRGVVHEPVAGIDVGTADHDDIQLLSGIGDLPRPGRTAARVARRGAGDQCCSAEADFVAILQDSVDLAGGPARVVVKVLAGATG